MKKLVSIILCVLMLAMSSSVLAENALTFDPAVVEQLGLTGEFVSLEDFGLQHAAYAQLYLHKVVPADFFHVC